MKIIFLQEIQIALIRKVQKIDYLNTNHFKGINLMRNQKTFLQENQSNRSPNQSKKQLEGLKKKDSSKHENKKKKKINYYFNLNYSKLQPNPLSLNFTTITQKNKSIHSPSNLKYFKNTKKSPSIGKMRIVSRKRNKSKKQIHFKNSINLAMKENIPLSSHSRKKIKLKKNINQTKRSQSKSRNESRMKLLSKDKIQPKMDKSQKNFKISQQLIYGQKDDLLKRESTKQRQDKKHMKMYLKLQKFRSEKARSIDNKKKKEQITRKKDFLSEDKQTQKYLLQNKPNYLTNQTKKTDQKLRVLQENAYYQKIKTLVNNKEELSFLKKQIKKSFQNWKNIDLAEFYDFKTKINFYKIKEQIGKGCFGRVYLATLLLTNQQVALKVIDKKTITNKDSRKKIEKEVEILKRVNNAKFVIKLFEVFEDEFFVYMVFEFQEKGDLVHYFKNRPLLEEDELIPFFKKIVHGVQNLHSHNIIHRDIKLDNILLDQNLNPKLIDFGISSFYDPQVPIYDTGGTPAYLAPEVIKAEGKVSPKSDVWSLGVLLYLLTFGIVPFKASDMQALYNKIIIGKFIFPKEYYTSIELIDLIGKMLIVDIDKRYSIQQILSHPWFRNTEKVEQNLDFEKNQNKKIEGIMLWLKNVGFSDEFLEQSVDKGLFNHIKACIDSLVKKIQIFNFILFLYLIYYQFFILFHLMIEKVFLNMFIYLLQMKILVFLLIIILIIFEIYLWFILQNFIIFMNDLIIIKFNLILFNLLFFQIVSNYLH